MILGGRRAAVLTAAVLAALLDLLVGPAALGAQAVAAGRVVRPGAADTMPVAGVRVVLHRVGSTVQGPIDSMATGAGGRFRFRFAPDTAAVYLLSARYHGIEYFSAPVPTGATGGDTGVVVLVHDTSSTAPVRLGGRHVVIPRAGEDGGREVIDLLVLRNEGYLTRVAPDTTAASWSLPLPPGSDGLEVGESDVSSEAVTRRGDSLYLAAPIGPGEKQLALQYHLPGDLATVVVPMGATGGPVNVLVEDPEATVTGEGLAPADTQLVLGRTLRRWSGDAPAGAVIRVALPRPGGGPRWVLAALVGAVGLTLGAAAWRARRAAPRMVPASSPSLGPEELLDRVARLDARYQGREGELPVAEWRAYLDERRRLKAELESALAATRSAG